MMHLVEHQFFFQGATGGEGGWGGGGQGGMVKFCGEVSGLHIMLDVMVMCCDSLENSKEAPVVAVGSLMQLMHQA